MTITYEANTEIFRLLKDREHSYTMISNEKQSFARDERLSPNAYTILSKVLSFIGMNEIGEDNSKKGWHFTISGFCTLTNMGETRVRNGLKELEQFGYFVREGIFCKGKRAVPRQENPDHRVFEAIEAISCKSSSIHSIGCILKGTFRYIVQNLHLLWVQP